MSNILIQGYPNITTPVTPARLNALYTGWNSIGDTTISFNSSTDAPVYLLNTSQDLRPYISLGMKFKFTHGGLVKFGIVVAITGTTISLYCGTDYTISNSAITEVYFSNIKIPYGFPMDKNKWSIKSTISPSLISVTNNTWVSFGSVALKTGLWDTNIETSIRPHIVSANSYYDGFFTFSTSSTAEINSAYTTTCGNDLPFNGVYTTSTPISKKIDGLSVTSNTTYYFLYKINTNATIGASNGLRQIVFVATCAYL